MSAADLVAAGLDPVLVDVVCSAALDEDIDGIDVTTAATVPTEHRSTMLLTCRSNGVISGLPVAARVFELVGVADIDVIAVDGAAVNSGQTVLKATGRTHALLRAERPALNLLGHLSGIATLTREWVDAVAGTSAQIRDTRKTTPGLRALEKYAVRCGGGVNHRMSLSDAALVKDNHVVAAGGVAPAFRAVRSQFPDVDIEVEVDDLDQFDAVVAAGADLILLDNFTLEDMRTAVSRRPATVRLEASGGLTIQRARAVAETGVDYLAVGALTHSAPVLDIGADLIGEDLHASRD
jgi:nicotinate-nucleotide pyrophosphorylase (carboxylating)